MISFTNTSYHLSSTFLDYFHESSHGFHESSHGCLSKVKITYLGEYGCSHMGFSITILYCNNSLLLAYIVLRWPRLFMDGASLVEKRKVVQGVLALNALIVQI
ncbi:hypothetical protein RchiOBHm_Chr1g0349281 [Rosa chinensis]|uniref:Uncharacterized protein n=1 Tax=Rosa chinensis TaxID=74649 RepID=A0A2P6SFU8_ROSCH|nr:hypothetical protein RchiOBHm_Chr1g0349281 [Rosa chinensis]